MNKRILIPLVALVVAGIVSSGLALAQSRYGIRASTMLSKRALEGSGDWTRIYIYVTNPKWQTVEIISIDIDWYVNGEHYGGPWTDEPPEWMGTEGEWDATVLPFERSVILWFRWTYAPEPPHNEPAGLNTVKFNIHGTIDAQDIQLKTWVSFRTL